MAWTDERLEERFDRIDERFNEIDRRLEGIEAQLVELRQGFAALNARIDRISIALLIGFISLAAALVVKGG